MITEKKKVLIIDPTGEYYNSFSLQEVRKLSLGIDTTISPGKVSMQQWTMLFETNSNTQSAVLSEAIRSLRYQQKKWSDHIFEKGWRKHCSNATTTCLCYQS